MSPFQRHTVEKDCSIGDKQMTVKEMLFIIDDIIDVTAQKA